MDPHRRLALLVTIAAVGIAVGWFLLYRKHLLAPPMTPPKGPSLSDIDRQFTDSLDRLRKLTETASPAPPSSDDARTPTP